jgi:predicted nuclease of predicted toxin-antitoxin system
VRFLADESVDGPIVERLRGEGHDVAYIAEMDPGLPDDAVLALSRQTGAILVTTDRDFGELVFRQGRLHAGVLLVRLPGLPAGTKASLVAAEVRQHAAELSGSFSVLSPGAFRVRRPVP